MKSVRAVFVSCLETLAAWYSMDPALLQQTMLKPCYNCSLGDKLSRESCQAQKQINARSSPWESCSFSQRPSVMALHAVLLGIGARTGAPAHEAMESAECLPGLPAGEARARHAFWAAS